MSKRTIQTRVLRWQNLSIALGATLLAANANAQAPAIESLALAGSGCPSSTDTYVSYDEHAGRLRLHPEAHTAQTSPARVGRSSCNLVATVQVPAGYRVEASLPAFWGPAELTANASGKASLEVFFNDAGAESSIKAERALTSATHWIYAIERASTLSSCAPESTGKLLRVNSNVFVADSQPTEASRAQIMRAGVTLRLVPCDAESI